MQAQKWNSSTKFPNDNFVCRVTDDGFSPSKSSGNPMITLTFETIGLLKNDSTTTPEIDVGGDLYTISEIKITNYYPTIVLSPEGIDESKTHKAQERVKELYEKFGMDNTNINFENPVLGFKGKQVMVYLQDEAKPKRRSPTKAQLEQGIREGEVILNPVTHEAVVDHWPRINRIYGLAIP